MKNKNLLLIKALLKSRSRWNIRKYTKDKDKKKKVISEFIGATILYLMLMAYCILMCVGFGQMGMIEAAPGLCAVVLSALSFIFTVLKTNGYLFNFKEYDMLMALPYTPKQIVSCRFIYMYITSLPMYLTILVSILIGYMMYTGFSVWVLFSWIILGLLIPVIPMLIASFLGFFVTKISSGFKKKNIIQTVLTILIMLVAFSSRFIIEAIFRDDQVETVLTMTSDTLEKTSSIYLPAKWFSDAICAGSAGEALLLIALTVLLFEVIFIPVGKSYRKINSALQSHEAGKKINIKEQKTRSLLNTIAFKEYKRMTGSSTYMVNVAFGHLLVAIFGLVVLFIGFDTAIKLMTHDAPISTQMLLPSIPFIVYFFIGMCPTTACSPSLEGKNFWIMKSLPIGSMDICRGKMLFNMYLSVPFMVFGTICFCLSAKAPVLDLILYLVFGFILCVFSTVRGCSCGLKYMNLEWENEVEVIKQGKAVTVYLLPNIFITMILIVGVIILGGFVDQRIIILACILVVTILSAIYYKKVIKFSKIRI